MKLIPNFIAVTISKGLNTPLLLLETILLGRILGPEKFGQWTLLLAAATILHTVFINWTHAITIRFGCEEWAQKKSLQQTLITRLPLLVTGFLMAAIILYFPINWFNKLYTFDATLKWLVFFILLMLWLTFEAQSYLQAKGLLSLQAIITTATSAFSIVILLLSYFILKNDNLLFIIVTLTLLKLSIWLSTLLIQLKKSSFRLALPETKQIKIALQYSWPIFPSLTLGYISDWGDHIIISWFCTMEDVGIWGSSYQMMLGIISLNSIFVTVLLPWLITKYKAHEGVSQFYIDSVVPIILSFWLLALIIIITFFPIIFVLIMGNEFKEGQTVLLILSIGILTNAFSSLYGILFNLQNRLKKALVYNFVIAITNFSLSLLLIPFLGIKGAAIGTCVSYLVGHALYIWDQHRFLSIPSFKIYTLFMSACFIGFMQYLVGLDIGLRIFTGLVSIFLLIYIIRYIKSVESSLLAKVFKGFLQPLGFILHKTLIKNT